MLSAPESKTFYKKFLTLSVPLAAQSLIKALMFFIDNIMVGSLGEDAIVGVGNANQIAFLCFIFVVGICSSGWVFTARYNGEGDKAGIQRTLGICLAGTVLVSAVFFVLTVTMPRGLIAIFNPLSGVTKEGGDYISIVGISYIFMAVSQSYANVLKGCEKTKLPMITALIALFVNAAINYVLIFGKFGMPKLGVKGAAIGTVVGAALDTVLLVVISNVRRNEVSASPRELFPPFYILKPYIIQFFRVGTKVIVNEVFWGIFAMGMAVIYNRMGLEVAAAMAVFSAIERLAYVVYTAIGNSCGVMVGNLLGEDKTEKAYIYARRFLKMTPLSAVVVGGLILMGLEPFLSLYDISAQTQEALRYLVYTWLCIAWLATFNYTNICGVLRSGGDARFSLIIDLVCSWLFTLVPAFLLGIVLELPLFIVYMISYLSGEGAKAMLGLKRFISRKWIRDITAQTREIRQNITN
ncbi:MAG: MATE family efflux transporter [Christensenellales bacterium]